MSSSEKEPLLHINGQLETSNRLRTQTNNGEDQVVNPLIYESNMDCYERTKIVFMCLSGILLVRLILFVAIFILMALFSFVATLGYSPEDSVTGETKLLGLIRRIVSWPNRIFFRLMIFLAGFHWISVRGKENDDPKRARIIVANHVTFVDGPYLVYACCPSVALKKDLAELPIFGRIIQTLQPILVDRKTPEGRRNAAKQFEAQSRPGSGFPRLLVFPEGTTSTDRNLTKFKHGAFVAGLPVQPVCLRYNNKHFDLSWPPTVSGGYLFFRAMCQFYNRLEVTYLPVYEPNAQEKEDPDLYADNVRQTMATAMGVPVSNHSVEDVLLLSMLGSDKYWTDLMSRTDMREIRALTAMRLEEVQSLLRRFAEHDKNKNFQLSFEEFTECLGRQTPELVERLFSILDAGGNWRRYQVCV